MRHGWLKLEFRDDSDGTGKLIATVEAGGFAGRGGAWFGISQIEEFADLITVFPLPSSQKCSLAGGFWKEREHKLDQEHLGIDIYPIGRRGHIGVQVRIASELWKGSRPEAQMMAKVEVITFYQPLLDFSSQLKKLVRGSAKQALLEGETLD
jgi:hypothetical protein